MWQVQWPNTTYFKINNKEHKSCRCGEQHLHEDLLMQGCQNKPATGAFHWLFWILRRLLRMLVGQFWAWYWRNKMEIAANFLDGTCYSLTTLLMRQDSTCSLATMRSSSFTWSALSLHNKLHMSLPSLSTVLQVWGVPIFFLPHAWGLMAGFSGFAIHGSSLQLGAGCQ